MPGEVETKYLMVSPGGFHFIPANSPLPVVVMCEGTQPGREPGSGSPTPDPEKIPQLTPRNPGVLERVSAGALEGLDLDALGEEVSTLVVEVDPSDPEGLSAVGDLIQNPGLAQRGIDIEVRGG